MSYISYTAITTIHKERELVKNQPPLEITLCM